MLCCLPILLTLDAVGWRAFQYIMLPFLLNGSFLATLVGNTLYLVAFVVYHYITFGGYTGAPDLALSCVVVGNKCCWLTVHVLLQRYRSCNARRCFSFLVGCLQWPT